MIRPRRTFQERNLQSAAKWDRLRTANRVRGWIRIISLFCIFGSLLTIIFIYMPSLSTIDTRPAPVIRQPGVVEPPETDTELYFNLGAEVPEEKLPRHQNGQSSEDNVPNQEVPVPINDDVAVDDVVEVPPDQPPITKNEQGAPEFIPPPPEGNGDNHLEVTQAEPVESERTDEGENEHITESTELEPNNKASAVVSSDGTVGNVDIGGTYDGNDLTLFQQITLPDQPILQHYDSTQNFWPLHAILKERGWAYATLAPPSRVTLWISRGAIPPRLKQGYQMLNSMGVSGCIGGAKSLQLECRRRLARLDGCDYDDLKIQPAQYNMLHLDDCKKFFADALKPERANKVYLSKPTYTFHGAGIRVHQGAGGSLKAEFGACKTPKNTILMDYVSNPATMLGGYKFDFRTYLLVASLKPQLVFYHDGFVRKSDRVYDVHSKDLNVHITNKVTQSKEEHFFNFTKLGAELHRELGLPPDHVDRYVRPRAKSVSRFLFQTTLVQPQPPRHVPGRFHLFGIDWLLDASGKLHLLEGNGYPLVTHYHGIDLTPRIWEEMMDLILAIQTKSSTLPKKMTVKDGYSFGGWKLVFNELEELMEQAKGNPYNSCKAFASDI